MADWQTWQRAQSLSGRTINERVAVVQRFASWLNTAPHSADSASISEWLADGGDWSTRTRQTYHGALTAWFAWLVLMGHRADNPMIRVGRPKRVRSEPRPITDENLRRILRTRMNRRSRAMVLLAAMQGLRAHEIAKVRGEHFDLVDRTMVITGKGGHRATLPLHHLVAEIAVAMPRQGWWFPGVDGGHQRRESVCGTVKEVMIRAGVPGSAHQLRHWFGTALVRAGVDLRTVQELMRHANLSSTAIYTQVADRQRAEGIQRLDPFGVYALKLPVGSGMPTADELRQKAQELLAVADKMAHAGTT